MFVKGYGAQQSSHQQERHRTEGSKLRPKLLLAVQPLRQLHLCKAEAHLAEVDVDAPYNAQAHGIHLELHIAAARHLGEPPS